jgi:hypothetical protein
MVDLAWIPLADFPREKPRWPALSVAYRLLHAAQVLFGPWPVMRWLLDAEWIAWRLAYEASGTCFFTAAMAAYRQPLSRAKNR